MYQRIIYGILIFISGLFISCEQRDEAAIQNLLQEQVAENIAIFKARQTARCHKEALEEAILVADSILIAHALSAKDTSRFVRPIKPIKPNVVLPTVTEPITPLFKDSL